MQSLSDSDFVKYYIQLAKFVVPIQKSIDTKEPIEDKVFEIAVLDGKGEVTDTYVSVFISIFGYAKTSITDANIQTAVDLWVSDSTAATTTYSAISTWDVSQVTDMSGLFYIKTTFNDDISNWDVSSVTNMSWMFFSVSSFNKLIENQYDEVLFSGGKGSEVELFC